MTAVAARTFSTQSWDQAAVPSSKAVRRVAVLALQQRKVQALQSLVFYEIVTANNLVKSGNRTLDELVCALRHLQPTLLLAKVVPSVQIGQALTNTLKRYRRNLKAILHPLHVQLSQMHGWKQFPAGRRVGPTLPNAKKLLAECDSTLRGAVLGGDESIVALMLATRADVQARDPWGKSALMTAAEHGRNRIVSQLLDTKASVNAKDERGGSALTFAARRGNAEAVQRLLNAKADINSACDSGRTALMYVCGCGGYFDDIVLTDKSPVELDMVVSRLLDAKADINTADRDGWTALMHAADHCEHVSMIDQLVQAGAVVHDRQGGSEVVNTGNGAIQFVGRQHHTALTIAERRAHRGYLINYPALRQRIQAVAQRLRHVALSNGLIRYVEPGQTMCIVS
jgi:hypothetical protein